MKSIQCRASIHLVDNNSARAVKDPAGQSLLLNHHLFNLLFLSFGWRGWGVAPTRTGKHFSRVESISKYLCCKNPLLLPDRLCGVCKYLQLGSSAGIGSPFGVCTCRGSHPDVLLPSFQDPWHQKYQQYTSDTGSPDQAGWAV